MHILGADYVTSFFTTMVIWLFNKVITVKVINNRLLNYIQTFKNLRLDIFQSLKFSS